MSTPWWVLTAVACGTFMATLDSSIVNIALPSLTKDLAVDLGQIKWVVVVYLLVITCFLLPFGRVSDQVGRKPIFQLGFLIFITGSALCGFSPSLAGLILFRGLQGIGAAMLMANGPAVITAAFPARERGAALGTLAMVVSVGLISGPGLGGLLITHLGWRWIFWINVPIGIAGLLLAQRFIRIEPRPARPPQFDWGGAVIQSLFLVSFILFFDPPKVMISGAAPLALPRWVMALIAGGFAVIFFKVESTVKQPLFDLALLRNRIFWTGNLAGLCLFVALSSVTVLTPFFLEEVLRVPTKQAGMFMTAIPLAILVVAPISGRLSDRLGSRGLSLLGGGVAAAALFCMSGAFGPGLNAQSPHWAIVAWLASIGVAMGLFQSPNNNAVMGTVPSSKLGIASATLATVRNLGLVTGTGLATTLFAWEFGVSGQFVPAMHLALVVGGMVALIAALLCFGKPRGPNSAFVAEGS